MSPTPYTLPADSFKDWQGYPSRAFVPNDRQRAVIEAVRAALDAGHYYSADVLEAVARILQPTPEQRAVRADKVEGGEFGMDCYYARRYLAARARFTLIDEAAAQLQPRIGLALGALYVGHKQCRNASIIEMDTPDAITVKFTRGGRHYTWKTDADGIKDAVQMARMHCWRADNWEQMTRSRAAETAAA